MVNQTNMKSYFLFYSFPSLSLIAYFMWTVAIKPENRAFEIIAIRLCVYDKRITKREPNIKIFWTISSKLWPFPCGLLVLKAFCVSWNISLSQMLVSLSQKIVKYYCLWLASWMILLFLFISYFILLIFVFHQLMLLQACMTICWATRSENSILN